MAITDPEVSVVIPTRNRGDGVVATIDSILKSNYSKFEIILVDQSTNQDTVCAIEKFLSDSRFRYLHSDTQGSGLSRNIGLKNAHGEFLAFADDDCIVSSNWISIIADVLNKNPRVAMVYCNVEPAPYNPSEGYIPAYTIPQDRIIYTIRDLINSSGIGAGMAFRREALQSIGGFDNCLGAGTKFHGGEDTDVAIRILMNHWWIYEASSATVTHFGFRYWHEGKKHMKGYSIGSGAVSIKPIKSGHLITGILLIFIPLFRDLFMSFTKLLSGKRPLGFMSIVYFIQGILKGFFTKTESKFGNYKVKEKKNFIH